MTMNEILNSKVKSTGDKITVSYEKKINVKQYETETLSAETTLELQEPVEGIARVFLETLLSAQLEYSVYVQAGYRGYVTQEELSARIAEIEATVNAIYAKANGIGVDIKKYMMEA